MTWEEHNKERVANIKAQVPIDAVLDRYGVKILTKEREFQYPCPLHGDGQDNSYSARMYPDTQSTYCFACHKARDVVGWVCDAEGLPFGKALTWIERTFGVKNIPKATFDTSNPNASAFNLNLTPNFDLTPKKEDIPIMEVIDNINTIGRKHLKRRRKDLTWEHVTKVYYALDNVCYDIQHDNITEEKAMVILGKIYHTILTWAQNDR